MRKSLIILLLMFNKMTHAETKPWTEEEKKLFVTTEVLMAADWLQTRNIAKHPEKFHEFNPILGEHPNMGRVNTFFLTQMVGAYYLTDILGENRVFFLTAHNIARGTVVVRNTVIGISIGF